VFNLEACASAWIGICCRCEKRGKENGVRFFLRLKIILRHRISKVLLSQGIIGLAWILRESAVGGGGGGDRAPDGLCCDSFRLSVIQVFIIRLRVCRCVSLAVKILVRKSFKCRYFIMLGPKTIISLITLLKREFRSCFPYGSRCIRFCNYDVGFEVFKRTGIAQSV
jgi:hypothetical protein